MLQDPRRLDPRRVTSPVGTQSESFVEDVTSLAQSGLTEAEVDASLLIKRQPLPPVVPGVDRTLDVPIPKTETDSHILDNSTVFQEQVPDEQAMQVNADIVINNSTIDIVDKESNTQKSMDIDMTDDDQSLPLVEADQLSPSTAGTPVLEEISIDLPVVPTYVELTEEQQKDIKNLAIKRIIDSYKQLRGTEFMQTRMALLSRLVAQVGVDYDWFLCFLFGEILFLTLFNLLLLMSTGYLIILYDNFVKVIMTFFICEIKYFLLQDS